MQRRPQLARRVDFVGDQHQLGEELGAELVDALHLDREPHRVRSFATPVGGDGGGQLPPLFVEQRAVPIPTFECGAEPLCTQHASLPQVCRPRDVDVAVAFVRSKLG
jgi:hypothetical protein